MFRFAAMISLSVAMLFAAVGCNKAPAKAVVTGTITFQGKPLPGGVIAFYCQDGGSAAADIQADGTYRVENVSVGDALITIRGVPDTDESTRHMSIKQTRGTAPPPPPPKATLPAKYGDMGTTDLKITVKAGENKHDIAVGS